METDDHQTMGPPLSPGYRHKVTLMRTISFANTFYLFSTKVILLVFFELLWVIQKSRTDFISF